MRRLVFPALLACGLVVAGAVPASAEPVPAASSTKAAAGKKICKVTDPDLPELSGIVATENGFAVVNDGSDKADLRKIFFLDDDCAIQKRVSYPSRPLDTEDLVLSPDGKTLWIADIGDNAAREDPENARPRVSLWSMPADGSDEPVIHRLSYPSGDKHDAEALLFNGDGTPIIVTKQVTGKTFLYTPTAPLKKNNETPVPMKRAGEIEFPASDTPGIPVGRLAQGMVTGGAVAPGGGRVTLRTYLDAYEWDVADGDVLGSLKNKPRKTALPNEPFGEAITYSTDGKLFYTVSDMGSGADQEATNYILRYTPATKIVEATTKAAGGGLDDGTSWYSDLSLTDITYLIGGVGFLGALLVGAGVIGIMRARKRRPTEPAAKTDDDTPDPLDARTELLSVGGPPQRPAAGAGNRPPGAAPSGPGVYGAKPPAAPPKGSGVYGGARPPQGGAQGSPQGGQPGARPGGGRPAGPPPAGPGGGRPGQGGGRPAQPGRPPQGGQAGRPAQPPARPGQGAQPGRPAQPPAGPGGGRPAQPPAGRPAQPPAGPGGGRPAQPPAGRPVQPPAGPGGGRPGQGGGRPAQPGRPPQGGQPGRPAQPPARPGQGGQPGGGVYGAPPPPPPTGRPPTGRPPGGGPQRPSGGQQPGRPDGGRQANGMNNYSDQNGASRERGFGNPGYGR